MMKRLAAIAVVLCLTACSSLQTMYQSPEVQQELQQLTAWAEQQALAYFTGHIGDLHLFGVTKYGARHYSASYVQQQAIVTAQSKYPHLTRDQITTVVQTQFSNTAAKVHAPSR